ncbi:7586_t:CDS:2, partial [Funneliformis caledonium]
NNTEWSVYSERSTTGAVTAFLKEINQSETRLSGPQIFGLDIGVLHQYRLKTSPTTSKKRPLSLIQTKSGQNKRLAAFGKDSERELSSLIKKHHMTT